MQHAVLFLARAGHFARIPLSHDGHVIDISEHLSRSQRQALAGAAADERREIASLLSRIVTDLDLIREAITMAIAHRELDDAMTALEELEHLSFVGAETVRPIVKTCFVESRRQLTRELYGLLCAAAEDVYGLPNGHFAEMR